MVEDDKKKKDNEFVNLKHSKIHPKFLHSNSTSHRWAFGAIAELIDNAMDPDVMATQFCIESMKIKDKTCLLLMDNGYGMDSERLYKMMGFGHSEKNASTVLNGRVAIGRYGNGFKSGSMRLGQDALVLTKCDRSQSVGLLSQTFLKHIEAEDVYIPMISWNLAGKRLNEDDKEVKQSLAAFCKYSIFSSEQELLQQLRAIPNTGTIVIISNLRRIGDDYELDADTDTKDIRLSSSFQDTEYQQQRPNQATHIKVPLDYSLRAYISVLYKVPRMQVFLRGGKVKTKRITSMLQDRIIEEYRPSEASERCTIEMGFNIESEDLYGVMIYHNNRLISPYVRVGMQHEANERGVGVLGIVDANFLNPTHNKQDFDDTRAFRSLIRKLAETLNLFWFVNVEKPALEAKEQKIQQRRKKKVPDVKWVQCDYPKCLKWRKLPATVNMQDLPEMWYCHMHPNPEIAKSNHTYPEESWKESVNYIFKDSQKRKKEWQQSVKAKKQAKREEGVLKQQVEGFLALKQPEEIQALLEAKNKIDDAIANGANITETHRKEAEVLQKVEEVVKPQDFEARTSTRPIQEGEEGADQQGQPLLEGERIIVQETQDTQMLNTERSEARAHSEILEQNGNQLLQRQESQGSPTLPQPLTNTYTAHASQQNNVQYIPGHVPHEVQSNTNQHMHMLSLASASIAAQKEGPSVLEVKNMPSQNLSRPYQQQVPERMPSNAGEPNQGKNIVKGIRDNIKATLINLSLNLIKGKMIQTHGSKQSTNEESKNMINATSAKEGEHSDNSNEASDFQAVVSQDGQDGNLQSNGEVREITAKQFSRAYFHDKVEDLSDRVLLDIVRQKFAYILNFMFHIAQKEGYYKPDSTDYKEILHTLSVNNDDLIWLNVEKFKDVIGLKGL